MGSECSVHKDYELEEPIECSNEDWILYPAHSKGNNPIQRVTIFVHKKNKKERKQDATFTRVTSSLQFLKVLRHPGILKYYGSYENSEVVMVTEPVEPLESALDTLDEDEIVAGLHNILLALIFLHEKGGLTHNNVSLSSVYVSNNDGGWKLGGMQCVCKPDNFNHQFLADIKPLRHLKAVTPEEQDVKVTLTRDTIHTIDAYGFGMLVTDILDRRDDIVDSPYKTFVNLIQNEFLHPEPKFRPKLDSLLDNDFFRNDYLNILTFLSNITIKTDIDKDKFFSCLASKLCNISPIVIATTLLPKLMSRFVMAEPSAVKEFLPHLLTPGNTVIQPGDSGSIFPILPLDLYKKYLIPILFKLWVVKDLHIRIILLKYFPLFAEAFEADDLEHLILPQMLLGLHDANDSLVSATFHALANLVPILGGEKVVGGDKRQSFKEGRPKFSLGSSQPIGEHTKLSINTTGKTNGNKALYPLNVSQALNMKTIPELPSKSKTEHSVKKTREREERKRPEKRKEIKKTLSTEKGTSENEENQKTLLQIAKEHSDSIKVEKQVNDDDTAELQPSTTVQSDDIDDEWEDFQMGDMLPNSESDITGTSKEGKSSPSRFVPTRTSDQYDMSDVDFTPKTAPPDLITWDTIETSTQSKPVTGKAMKLGSKKPAKQPPMRNLENLGQMFEIPDISVKSKEPDFFADMQPDVEFQCYDGGIGGLNAKSVYSKKMDVASTAQVGGDWNVDDWTSFD